MGDRIEGLNKVKAYDILCFVFVSRIRHFIIEDENAGQQRSVLDKSMLPFPITLYSFICLETPNGGLVSEPSVAVLTGIQLVVHQLVIYIIVGIRKWALAMPSTEFGF